MLSVENSPPASPDPNIIVNNSTRTPHPSHNHDLDLPSPPSSLPNFSIRDYVYTARSKDIKRNWPFSLKNLQLCLKHGVKDLLPPFQPLDAVRNQAFIHKTTSRTVDNNYHDHQNIRDNIINDGVHQPTTSDNHDHDDQPNNKKKKKKLADQYDHSTRSVYNEHDHLVQKIASCRTSGENCFPSSTTTTSSLYDQSEIIEESVVIPRSTSSPLQTDTTTTTSTSLEAASVDQVERKAAGPRVAVAGHRSSTQSVTRNSGKRCRLIVKFSSNSDRNSAEDIASNCTNQSEIMNSKICPVCKTFSSSSNTTLNAHIDQCLSAESSAPKWTLESKLTRHRIKPSKKRLMVDIYATAKCCTLEDLDRRNGSNWAAFSSFPFHEESDKSETTPVEDPAPKQQAAPPHNHQPTSSADHVGAVYIDANGVKVRILSKSDDNPSVSKVMQEHLCPRKPVKGGGKGGKFLSARKKKRRASKLNKYFKVKLAQNKKSLSSKAPPSQKQISGFQRKRNGAEARYEKEQFDPQKPVNISPCNTGTLRQWVCSKRTGVAKKFNNKVSHQHVHHSKWHVTTDNSRIESDQLHAHSPSGPKNLEEDLVDLSGSNPISSIFYDEAQANHKEEEEQSSGVKIRGNVVERKSLTPLKRDARQLRKEKACVNDNHMLETTNSELASAIIRTKSSRSCYASRSKSMKISSARKDLISSAPLNMSEVRLTTEMDDEVMPWDSEADHGPYDFNHNFSANQYGKEDVNDEASLCRSNGLELRQYTGVLGIPRRKETVASESSQLPSQRYADKEGENIDSSVSDKVDDDGEPFGKDFERSMDEIAPQMSSKIAVVENHVVSSRRSVELGNHSRTRSSTLQYKGPLCDVEVPASPSGPSFVGGQVMFYADHLGKGMEELDSEIGQGSSFPDVDPIPIPGPPGSYLPSPRDMGSEDFQGNSSLTTSRVQSSQDQHDFVDGDSSDSPVSATSTVSNSTGSRYDLKCSEPLIPSTVGPDHAVRYHKIRSSISGGSFDSSIENAAAERLPFDKEKLKVNNKLPLTFIKSDHNEPCCCQRKERVSQGVILNYQESPLLKRRAMTSSSVVSPPVEKQTSCNPNGIRPNNTEGRPLDMFSPRPEKVVLPVTAKSLANENISRCSRDSAGVKFSVRSECDSVSPSSSNSVLRLMGKNLMVVNRDQDESIPQGQAQPLPQINHLVTSQFAPFSGISHNQVYRNSFHPNFRQGSVILGQDGNPHFDAERQCVVDTRTGASFPRTSTQMFCQGAASSFPNEHVRSAGFGRTMELCEFKADHSNATTKSSRHRSSVRAPATMPAHHHHHHPNVLSSAATNYPIKEIIAVDDVSENEADLAGHETAKYSRGALREESHLVSSAGIVITGYNNDAKYPTPFYSTCQSDQDHQSVLPDHQSAVVLQNTGFHSLPSSRLANNASPVRWNGGGSPSSSSVVLQQNPFIARSTKSAASRGGHPRSTLYNCQSLL